MLVISPMLAICQDLKIDILDNKYDKTEIIIEIFDPNTDTTLRYYEKKPNNDDETLAIAKRVIKDYRLKYAKKTNKI